MSLPVIREVEYTDDGCTLYECLNCYQKIESRSGGFDYCPYCGCKFDYGFVSKQKEFWDNPRFRTERLRLCNFVLWERFKWGADTEWSDWHVEAEGDALWVLRRKKEIWKIILSLKYTNTSLQLRLDFSKIKCYILLKGVFMKDSTKLWEKGLDVVLDEMVSLFRKSIINDAETFAKFRDSDTVNAQALEIALYKSVMTLNESNKAIMFQRLGPVQATNLISTLEERAISDVSLTVIEDMEDNMDKLPEELRSLLMEIKKKLRKDNDKKEI